MQAHGLLSDSENTLDIHDAPVWKQAFKPDGIFKGDPRGIGLSLCTDGVNPFSHQQVTYSMWPIMMTILNLPRHVRNSFSNILLLGIIPGSGRKEAQSLSSYLELIVDELLSLADISLFDAYKGAPFKVKVELMLYILDYPGVCKIFNVSGSGAYKGCMWCDIKGVCTSITHASCIEFYCDDIIHVGTYNKELTKMVYLQNRRFLPLTSPIREEIQNFPSHGTENRVCPGKRTYSEIRQLHEAYSQAKSKYVSL